jgi:hypothetical protein
MYDRHTLKAYLKAGRLTEAAEMVWEELQRSGGKRTANWLFDGMSAECGVALYGLIAHMIQLYGEEVVVGRYTGSTLHDMARALLLIELCWPPGAEALALHHSRRLVELTPNDVSRLEGVLYHYGAPDKVLSDEEAFDFAHRVLKLDPKNKRALEVLAKLAERRKE